MENKKQTKHRKKHRCKKVILQIAMACALLCSVIRWIPENAFALTQHHLTVTDTWDNNKKMVYSFQCSSSNPKFIGVYDKKGNSFDCYFISTEPFTVKQTIVSDSETSDNTFRYLGSFEYENKTYYYLNLGRGGSGQYSFESDVSKTLYFTPTEGLTQEDLVKMLLGIKDIPDTFFWSESGDSDTIDKEASEGTKDNPIQDADIGTLIISGKALNQDKSKNIDGLNNDFSSISDQLLTTWTWKNKTSTGFSLSKNKYARTFIQVKVESRCLVYKNLKHTEIKEKWNSYGETATLYTELPVDQNPKVIYLTDILNALPNTKAENHNILYSGMNFRYYWRVVCTDDLAVIPSDTAKWHCGGWRAVDLNMDSNTSKEVNDASNGHFDDNGKWVDDEDDGYNDNINDSSGEVDDVDDAKDKVVEKPSSTGDDFSWNDFKSLINQCKQVPDLIKGIFSFLPDWVLKFVAIGFGIWIFVLIKRAIV